MIVKKHCLLNEAQILIPNQLPKNASGANASAVNAELILSMPKLATPISLKIFNTAKNTDAVAMNFYGVKPID